MSKEKRLGRGLEALLGRVARPDPQPMPRAESPAIGPYGEPSPYGDAEPLDRAPPAAPELPAAASIAAPLPPVAAPAPPRAPIKAIERNPYQPRQEFDETELQSLADSLRAHGLLQPIVVRRTEEGRYQLVAGERRLRAAAKAGWTDVPVQLVEADDRDLAELAIVENLQRKDLNALEKAASFQRYLEQYGCTQEELASRLKLDRSTISNLIRLLELPDAVQEAVRRGQITPGHARSLLPLGDEQEQIDFCRRIAQEGLSVRQTETMVQEAIAAADAEPLGQNEPAERPSRTRRITSEHVAILEQEFRTALGTKVQIAHSARGRGKLTIHFASHEEFERLRAQICQPGGPNLKARVG